jgi:hypothetical protein
LEAESMMEEARYEATDNHTPKLCQENAARNEAVFTENFHWPLPCAAV